jgi:hypothetical protein
MDSCLNVPLFDPVPGSGGATSVVIVAQMAPLT